MFVLTLRTDHWNAIRVSHGAPNGWASMMTTHWGPLAAHALPACAPNHTCSVSGNSDKKPRWRENHKQWVSLLLLLIFVFVYSRIIFLLDIYAICTMNMKYYVCAHSKTFWKYTLYAWYITLCHVRNFWAFDMPGIYIFSGKWWVVVNWFDRRCYEN